MTSECECDVVPYFITDDLHTVLFDLEGIEAIPIKEGIRGEVGPPGTGANRYRHTQSIASNHWVVNHNFGYFPTAVSVRSPGGVEVDANVTHISINQLTVNFSAPYVGTADTV